LRARTFALRKFIEKCLAFAAAARENTLTGHKCLSPRSVPSSAE
jgi:hypothetical protein